jgi:riboflavin synthase
MFTGIIQAVGTIAQIESLDKIKRFQFKIDNFLTDSKLGESIAVNGVCLTITMIDNKHWSADVSAETFKCTTFDNYKVGDKVNFEKSLRLNQGLDGHMVSGHIDGVGQVVEISDNGENKHFKILLSEGLLKTVIQKGSITINGVSLTINKIENNIISINLVPHTIENTQLRYLQKEDKVNIEIDMIAKYITKLINNETQSD